MTSRQLHLWRLGCSLCGCMLLLAIAEARPWTSSDGQTVEAEFVELSADGKSAVLDIRGRRFTVPLDRLSEADRAYVADLQASSANTAAEGEGEKTDAAEEDLSSELREPRVWTARDGTTVRARLIRIHGGAVLLRENDRTHRVRFYDLSLADRQFLAKAFRATGQGDLVPPVRPELVDLVVEPPAPATSPEDNGAETSADRGPSGDDTPELGQESEIVLPPSGFGSMDDSGQPETQPEETPAEEPGADIVLPDSGFGSLDEDESDEAPMPRTAESGEGFGAEVVLPPSGFGSVPASSAGSADDFFEEAGNDSPPDHVKVPQSTVGTDQRLPPSGFGSAPAESPALPASPTPEPEDGFGSAAPPGRDQVASNDRQIPSQPMPGASSASGSSTKAEGQQARTAPRQTQGSQSYTPQRSPRFAPLESAPAELSGAQWNLRFFGILLLSGGCLLSSSSYLWLIAAAFQEGYREGLRQLIPGSSILLTLTDAERSNTPLITMMLGVCLAIGGCGLLLS